MTNQELVKTDILRSILDAAGSNYVAAYDQIVGAVEDQARTAQIVNRSTRVERWKAAVAKRDRNALVKADELLSGLIAKVKKNARLSENDEPRQLTVTEAKTLMDEMVDIKEAKTILAAREEEVKRLAFGHMTEQFAAEGETFPEHVNGSIDVPELGFRFSREGCGRKDPELNEKALRALVGEEAWKRIVDVEIIPAQTVESVSIAKLMAEAQINPTVLDHLESTLKVGEWKTPRLNIREL